MTQTTTAPVRSGSGEWFEVFATYPERLKEMRVMVAEAREKLENAYAAVEGPEMTAAETEIDRARDILRDLDEGLIYFLGEVNGGASPAALEGIIGSSPETAEGWSRVVQELRQHVEANPAVA